jgi:hypothetical protein
MLGRKTLAADATATAPVDFDTAQLAAGELELGFTVEEDEMLVDLEARLVYTGSAVGTIAWTFYVDGAASPDLAAAGIYITSTITDGVGDAFTAMLKATLRLDKGYHTVDVRVDAAAGNVTYPGATTMPSEVTARRSSHIGTLGHGVDAKAQLVQ